MDGQVITPNCDHVQNITTYEFTANAPKDAPGSECVFQFIPNAVGSITMTLIYDDSVDSSYDKQSTLCVYPCIDLCAGIYNSQSLYKNADIDFIAPEPSFEQAATLPGTNGID